MVAAFMINFFLFLLPLPMSSAFLEDPRIEHPEIDDDLAYFRSRPDLRPPLFDITVHDTRGIAAGYWFMAPYSDLSDRRASSSWTPAQVAPHIFDENGELVWSGGHRFHDTPTFDFTVIPPGDRLSLIVKGNAIDKTTAHGYGAILDASYNRTHKFDVSFDTEISWNMHEFNVLPSGRTAIKIVGRPYRAKAPPWEGVVEDEGIVEFDLSTGEVLFNWWAMDDITVSETSLSAPEPGHRVIWDFIHINSGDKDNYGNYIISGRYTNTIYNVSQNGTLNWRLGGIKSDFQHLNGLNFSGQHNARVQSQGPNHSIISFFNNAGNQYNTTSDVSAAYFVRLDFINKTARLAQKFDRPDGQLTQLRGNVQVLKDSVFICWAGNGYISEHSLDDGRLLFEARFRSERFVTYRAYKFNFTAYPTEPPAMKAWVYGETSGTSTTVSYVSWNGATEVATWRFYGGTRQLNFLGQVQKTKFETTFAVAGCISKLYAEAYAANGTLLGRTASLKSILPANWQSPVCTSEGNLASHAPVSIIGGATMLFAQLQVLNEWNSGPGLLIIIFIQFLSIIVLLSLLCRGPGFCISRRHGLAKVEQYRA